MKRQTKKGTRAKQKTTRTVARGRGKSLTVVVPATEIRRRILAMAKKINRDYRGKSLHVVGVLENCFVFMGDLVRALTVPVVCHFVKAESRETAQGARKVLEIRFMPRIDAHGKDVLLVDGVLQSGLTLDHLIRCVLGQQANSVKTAILVEKSDEVKADVNPDYLGFKTKGKYIVGFGLGYQDQFRNLPYLAALK